MQNRNASTHKHLDKSVAWVTPFLGRDGKLMYMEPLLEKLSRNCTKFTAITPEYPADINAAPINILVGNGMRRIYWKGKDNYLKGFTFIGPGFLKTITSTKADVLFLVEFSMTTIYGILVQLVNRKTKTILVMESRPVKNEELILGFLKKKLRKFIAKKCDAIITNNRSGREFLINELDTNPKKIIAKPYLISYLNQTSAPNLERFKSLNSASKINFLYVGRLMQAKGLQYLVDAIKLIPDEYKERMHVDIVGGGDYRDELTKYIADNNLSNNFTFHGAVEYSELTKFYGSAHVFIFPTLRDYRALVPFEALNAGLPIISSIHDGGVYESVSEGENGYICDPVDITAFSEAIMKVLSQPEKLYQYSLKSVEMSSEYTLDNAVDNLIEVANLAFSQT